LELVSNTIIKTIKNEQINIDQFKIVTSRQDKTFPINSMDFSKLVGANILKAFNNAKVDVKKPLTKINIEIKQKYIVIYYKKIKGMGGFPLGINGRALMMLSGGIDSPIASYLLLKKGMNVDFVTFISPPHTNPQVLKKVQKIIEVLSLKKTIYSPRLFVVNFTNLQHEISHIKNKSYQITIMRRYFFRIANEILQKYHYDVLATGESIGQVASQTIDSMFTISSVLNDTLILRPLLTFDKEEIINLSRQIGTYEISILPFEDTCSLFVPANPVTKPKKKIALELEQQLELIDHIYQSTLQKNIEIID
jgi:thiamine biosynthesis protein ThiI